MKRKVDFQLGIANLGFPCIVVLQAQIFGCTCSKHKCERSYVNMKHIMTRHDEELIKQMFLAQKEQPTREDSVKLVSKDINVIGITYKEAITNQ